jgi:lipopolysaccharide export LptBFGC system permease protein LptF
MYLESILFAFQAITVAPTSTSGSQIFLFIPAMPLALAFILVGIFGGVYFIRQKKTIEAISLVNTMLLAIIILLILIRL